MPSATHPDLTLSLVTVICLLAAWGPAFAAIAIGVASGFRAGHDNRGKRTPQSNG